jgi:hypothetical protein
MTTVAIQIEQTLERHAGRKPIESPRCEREYVQNCGFDPCSATPCNAPGAQINEKAEMFLCGSCAEELEMA